MEKPPELKFEKNLESPEAEKENFGGFLREESRLQEKIGRAADEITPQKLKHPVINKALRLLAALSIFMGGSSYYAKGASAEEIKDDLRPSDKTAAESFKAEDSAWKKFIGRLDITVSGSHEDSPSFESGVSDDISTFENLTQSDFYKDFPEKEYKEAVKFFYDSIRSSDTVKDYCQKLNQRENFSGRQKTPILQILGAYLSDTYNYDMLDEKSTVKVSDEVMFNSVKLLAQTGEKKQTGICGNIHTFLSKAAKEMGMEAWTQSVSQNREGHICTGFISKEDGQDKQIVFLNYGAIIPTGTLDYKDALGILERQMGAISALDSFASSDRMLLVKSRAQEKIEQAAGIADTGQNMENKLAKGRIEKEENSLDIKISEETKSISLTKDCVGLTFFNYENAEQNPYQSLEDLNALRGSLNLKGEKFSLQEDATILHLNLKNLEGGNIAYDEFINRIAADFIDRHQFNKSRYGQFVLNYGASLQTALRLAIDEEIRAETSGVMGEGATGARMIYLDPNNIGKFYIGVSEVFQGQVNNFEEQNLTAKTIAENFTVGEEIEIREGKILNLEAVKSNLDWGKKMEIKGGLAGKKWRGEIKHEKSKSEYERFIPSGQKNTVEIGYKGGPKWEVDVLGFRADEKYADAPEQKSYGAEVKMRIFLW
ncbi:MAG: hypothetical protein V1667_03395 [bacterium]